MVAAALPEREPPRQSLSELVGPTPEYIYDEDEKVVGMRNQTLHTVAIKATVDFSRPDQIPDPTPEQVQEMMNMVSFRYSFDTFLLLI